MNGGSDGSSRADPKTLTRQDVERFAALPTSAGSAFVSGSLLEGWGHATSDLDVYIVSDDWSGLEDAETHATPVALEPSRILTAGVWVGEGRWDLQYWLAAQVDQVFAKVEGDPDSRPPELAPLGADEIEFLHRLSIGHPVFGGDWFAERVERLGRSRFQRMEAARMLASADGFLDDALGLLETGDLESAVLAAHRSLRFTIDGFLCHYGELNPSEKWRARKFRRAQPAEISWDEYWALETMRDLDRDDPAAWVLRVVERCRELQAGVPL